MSWGPTSRLPVTLLDGASANSSVRTSNSFLVADMQEISLSLQTSGATTTSRYSVWGSNEDGFFSTIPENSWSVITAIGGPGVYTCDPGFRWLRVTRSALDSQGTCRVTGRS